jgi:hypothetical protein
VILRRRSLLVSVSAAACLSAAAVYAFASGGGDGHVKIAAPSPSAKAAALCRSLHKALPGTVDGLSRRTVEPDSVLTAGWGDPTVALRCGVPRPDVLTPGNAKYDPTANAAEVNGVSWLVQQLTDGYRFTTTDRAAFVEVTVPGKYAPEVNPLTDLAAAVMKTDPTGL